MTHLQRLLNTENISPEYIVGVCGVRLTDLQSWAQNGVVPEIYAPTLAKLFDVEINQLYGKEVEIVPRAIDVLKVPVFTKSEVGHL